MTDTKTLRAIVDEAATAARVVERLGLSRLVFGGINEYGLICNCDFHIELLREYGLRMEITEAVDGRGVITIRKEK